MIRDGHYRRNTARFLAEHPNCQIGVVDEYGRTHHPDGTTQEDNQ